MSALPRTATRTAARTAVAAAVVLAALGLTAPAQSAQSAQAAHTGPTGTLHTVAVSAGTDPAQRALAARATKPFSMVGVTWDDPYAQLGGTAEVRTRSSESGKWSAWRALDTDVRTPESGPDHARHGLRAGTQPLWTGASDGVQARLTGAHGKALPQGLRVELVDPDGGTSSTRSTMSATTAQATTAGQPPITSRAAWGADESIVVDPPTYTTDTKAVFVHHTAGTNNYTCAESASIIRGILIYHVKSNGWNDIGYNFLVDKCGTLFEGRAGGIDKPVYGAHTYGFNTNTSGIAVLGDYNTATTTPVVRESIAKLAAWKLGLYGINPSGTVVMAAGADNGKFTAGQLVTMNRISGHRDGYPTECPGNNLYADLPAIRTLATDVNSPSPAGDYNRDGRADLAAGIPQATVGGFAGAGQVSVVPGARSGPYAAARTALTQDSAGVPDASEAGDAFGAATAYGDLDHDGYADLIVGAPGEERTDATDEGALTVFRGNPNGLAAEATSISPKQSGDRFGAALATGDFDGDGSADILAVAAGSGRAYAVDGADRTLSAPAVLAEGPIQDTDIATGDFDHDGYTDAALTFRTETGSSLAVLRGSAEGLRTADLSVLAGADGRSVAAGDLNGDGYADLAVGRPDAGNGGEIATYHGSADGLTTTGAPVLDQSTPGVPGGAEEGDRLGSSVAIGDTDGDGYADVLAGLPGEDLTVGGVDQADAGAVLLLHGSPTGLTATGSATYNTDQTGVPGAAEAADRLGSAVALADFTGDGYADLGIGSDGENGPDGTVLTLNSGPTGVTPASGLYFGPATLGAAAGSHIGDVLAR
ncbi:FG-GAP-like repeat-containing protein [Streptomyces sp. NPDC051286]|uniref:FG-GAP-like repeat-containing protein n=1 Tax=Streptomyces sp. NPDC051286 TaxID=3365647 RepID=UPI0037BD3A7B